LAQKLHANTQANQPKTYHGGDVKQHLSAIIGHGDEYLVFPSASASFPLHPKEEEQKCFHDPFPQLLR
jgi:hypothetical protein